MLVSILCLDMLGMVSSLHKERRSIRRILVIIDS